MSNKPEIKNGPYVLGADNGYTGWVVILDVEDGHIEHMEQYPRENPKRLFEICAQYKPLYAAIEQPFMAAGFKGVAAANFEVLGRYCQTFEYCNIDYETIRAVSWRKVLGIKATATHNEKGEPISKRDSNKFAAEAYAEEYFSKEDWDKLHVTFNKIIDHKRTPVTTPDDNKVESALLAVYAREQWRTKCQ
jgi:hypothetical protein